MLFRSSEGAENKGFARTTAAGAPAWRTRVRIETRDGVLFVLSTFFDRDGSVWVMHGYAAEADFPTFEAPLLKSMDGFANETDPAVLGIQPVRIGITPAGSSMSFGEFARAHPIPDGATIDSVAGLAILNGVEVGDQLQPGQRMKVLVRNTR